MEQGGGDARATGPGVTLARLLLPSFLLFAGAAVLLGGLVLHNAYRLDTAVRDRERATVAGLLALDVDSMATLARDYAWWDDAVLNLARSLDPAWADDNIGTYLADNYGLSASFVLTPDGRTVIAFVAGMEVPADVAADDYVDEGLAPLVAKAQAGELAESVPAAGLVRAAGVIQVAAVAPLTPEHPEGVDLEPHDRSLLVFLRPLDTVFEPSTALQFSLSGVAVRPSPAAGGKTSVMLRSAGGEPLGTVSWSGESPGLALLQQLYLPAVVAIVAGLAALWLAWRNARLVVRHERGMLDTLRREREVREMRSRFVTTVSHRFRTPLATIQAAADLVASYRDRMSDEDVRQEAEAIMRGVDDLRTLIDRSTELDAADWMEIESRPSCVDIAALARETWEALVEDGRVAPALEIVGEGSMRIDARLLGLVLSHLLDNAIKFSDGRGRVTLTIDRIATGMCLSVTDQGIGIDEEDPDRLTQPFVRGRNAGNRPGVGIGLAVTLHTLTRLGGGLKIASEPGKGTIVTVTIPGDVAGSDRRVEI